jgi:hypothetical protein
MRGGTPLPFTNGFYLSRSKPLSAQRCINWYPNVAETAAVSESNLYPTPGLVDILDNLDGIGRGLHLLNGVLYAVAGQKLYRIDESLLSTEIGAIDGTNRVIMASDANQLVIVVPDEFAYCYTVGGSLIDLSGVANFISPVCDVVQINSKFVFAQTGTNIIFHSDLNQADVYSALNQYIVVQYPKNKGLQAYRNTLYCMGDFVTVPFSDQSQLEFAFRPIPQSVIDSGLAYSTSKTGFRDSFIFIGSGENAERSIWLFAGGSPQKISTEPIDFIIQNESLESVEKSFVLRHSQNGAEFAAVFIGDYCFVYDFASGRWHERRSRILVGVDYVDAPWRVNSIQQAYNKVFVLDSDSGYLGEITDSAYNEYGISIYRKVVTQPFNNNSTPTRVYAIEPYFDVGYEPNDVISMRWSDDGGFTWSEPLSRGLGEVGEYGRRVVFDRLGMFVKTRMAEFTYTGQNPCSFNKLLAR